MILISLVAAHTGKIGNLKARRVNDYSPSPLRRTKIALIFTAISTLIGTLIDSVAGSIGENVRDR